MLKYEFAGLPDYIDMTFQQSIDSMKEGFRRKWQWMDNNIRNL